MLGPLSGLWASASDGWHGGLEIPATSSTDEHRRSGRLLAGEPAPRSSGVPTAVLVALGGASAAAGGPFARGVWIA